MNYFRCTVGGSGKGNTVIVTCAEEFAGLTITLSKTGKTYTKTCPSTAPYEVTFYGVENGTYTVSCTVDGETYSETVIVQDISCVLNYGFKWQTWVDTASQLDSSDYDSLDEVLADEKALRELFLEHACVDYMASVAASNEDLETVINNDYCAKWINLSDYALDFLGANTVIKALMDEADKYGYGEWALMPQVPTMTSNTAPYGEVSASSVRATGTEAYRAFDGSDSSYWAATTGTNGWISYKFSNPISVRKVKVFTQNTASLDWQVRYSDDGSSWTNVVGATGTSQTSTELFINLNDAGSHLYWSVLNTNAAGTSYTTSIYILQFYAWAPKGNVPKMTSNTAPYGEAIRSRVQTTGNEAFKAFDNDSSTNWMPTNAVPATTDYIGYKFTNPIIPKKVRIERAQYNATQVVAFEGSNDNSTWVAIGENISMPANECVTEATVTTNTPYLYLRTRFISQEATSIITYASLQFYGRELKVSVPVMTSNTAPFGEAFASSSYPQQSSHIYLPWKAFDGVENNVDDNWASASNKNVGEYLGYDFKKNVVVKAIKIVQRTMRYMKQAKLQGSNDGATWEDITASITVGVGTTTPIFMPISNEKAFSQLRLICTEQGGDEAGHNVNVMALQFYCLDYSEKEFEEGTTKKWLYDHGLRLETLDNSVHSSGDTAFEEDERLKINVGAGYAKGAYWYVNDKVDLTNYSFIAIKGNVYENGDTAIPNNIAVTKAKNLDMGANNNTVASGRGNYYPSISVLNVSSINESYYVMINGMWYNSNKINKYEIEEAWLE